MTHEDFTDIVAFCSYIFAAYAVGIKLVLLGYYATSEYWKMLIPRIMIGASHVLLMALTVLSLNFRIFIGGESRFYASIVAGTALVLSAFGLTVLLRRDYLSHVTEIANPSSRHGKK